MTNPSDHADASGTGAATGMDGDDRVAAPDDGGTTKDVATDQAAAMKDTAVEAGASVATTAKHEAANVASEAKRQAKDLFGSVTSEVESQAGTQQQKVAAALASLSNELSGMAAASEQSGPLTDLAEQASRKGEDIAKWLETHEPRDVLAQVSAFARRRPGSFLGICFLAGVVAGRVSRAAAATNTSAGSGTPDSAPTAARASLDSPAPAGPVTDQPRRGAIPAGEPPVRGSAAPATDRSVVGP